ncbi:hypothetical protein DRN85_00175 [Methanosarcinales archaeon]|nr:MAG: hypothetical protein DRN85_00175 [Methanosarcinales archaeon]
MTLAEEQFGRLEYLLGKSQSIQLTPKEEKELRNLIEIEQPKAKDTNLDDLISLGLILVGAYVLLKALSK